MRTKSAFVGLCVMTLAVVCGCLRHAATPSAALDGVDRSHYQHLAKQIEIPEPQSPTDDIMAATPAPMSLENDKSDAQEYLDLSLEETIQLALANSPVLRDLGGTMLRTPDVSRSRFDASTVETDPRFGVESALSAFDAAFTTNSSYENNDRALNNVFFGGGTRLLKQNFATWQTQLSKTATTGTQFAIKNYTQYDRNNAPGNEFPSAWTTWNDIEATHPLLQGSGVDFNRMAGPNAQPGAINGVVVARINTDTALAEFEIGVRNFVSDVENAYWDLYFAYRDVAAKIRARDATLKTWRRIHALHLADKSGGEPQKEAQAREQYFRFEEEAQNALHGKLIDGTRSNNGSSGGTFRGSGGVYVVERRLRLLVGLPISDGRLIRPTNEPIKAKVSYNWESCLLEALTRRAELRRQKWVIKKREVELQANKNFLLPRLDVTGRYRWRGFGNNLFPSGSNGGEFNNALADLASGQFQEWQAGVELSFPIGFRKAYAAVRNAELHLARERALLHEQERYVIYDLSNSFSEVERAYALVETNLNRRIAAAEQVAAIEATYESETDTATLYVLLEGQRRLADAETAYFRSLVEYQLAVKNVQLEKGTLLDYNDVFLNEGDWPDKAYADADERESMRRKPAEVQPAANREKWLSQGTYPQLLTPRLPDGGAMPVSTPAFPQLPPDALPPSQTPQSQAPANQSAPSGEVRGPLSNGTVPASLLVPDASSSTGN
jgi:Outer membrane efflux protein